MMTNFASEEEGIQNVNINEPPIHHMTDYDVRKLHNIVRIFERLNYRAWKGFGCPFLTTC